MQPDHLAKRNSSRHSDIVCQTSEAIKCLRETGEHVTFYRVAEKAHVARSTLYRRDDLRKLVTAAREGPPLSTEASGGRAAHAAELERQLAQVTAERDMLRRRAREASSRTYSLVSFTGAA